MVAELIGTEIQHFLRISPALSTHQTQQKEISYWFNKLLNDNNPNFHCRSNLHHSKLYQDTR